MSPVWPQNTYLLRIASQVRPQQVARSKYLPVLGAILVLTVLLAFAASSSSGQFAGIVLSCDSARLQRCHEDVVQDIKSASLNAASSQYALTGSGPPYSQSSSSSALAGYSNLPLVSESSCRLVRLNFDCLLQTTPACYDAGYGLAQNTDTILRAKRFLEDNKCNAPDTSWQATYCYRSTQVKLCEDMFLASTKHTATVIAANSTVCRSYLDYRQCVERHVRVSCKSSELDMLNEYLVDKASDLAWRCPSNNASSDYRLSNYHATVLAPLSNSLGAYDQRPIPSYSGTSHRDKFAWERFSSPYDNTNDQRYGVSRYYGSGEVFDRLSGASRFEDSDCPVRAAPYTQACEKEYREQQLHARDSRDGTELQRRFCCALYQYKDCISRIVVERCVDGSLNAVEILMGRRRAELNSASECPGYFRDFCSAAMSSLTFSLSLALALALIATIITLKQ